jgi:hypothetical protein
MSLPRKAGDRDQDRERAGRHHQSPVVKAGAGLGLSLRPANAPFGISMVCLWPPKIAFCRAAAS